MLNLIASYKLGFVSLQGIVIWIFLINISFSFLNHKKFLL